MRLYEPALVMKTPPLSDSDSLISEPFLRADALGNCLESSRESFAALISIPSVQLSQLPLTGTALLAFTIVTSCRLMFLDTLPDWQPEVARKRLDLGAALRGMADNFAVADRWAVEKNRKRRLKEDCDSRGCHYTSRLRWIRQWYLSKTGGQDVQPQSEENEEEQSQVPLENAAWPDVRLDFEFWPDLMSMSDLGMPSFPGSSWNGI